MGHRPRWGGVWGVTIPMGTKMDFSEYSSLVVSPHCVLSRPLKLGVKTGEVAE